MNSLDEQPSGLLFQPNGNLKSPFLEGELLGEEAEPARERRLEKLQSESPFASAFEGGSGKAVELDIQGEMFNEEVEVPISEDSSELQEIESSSSEDMSAEPLISEEDLSNIEEKHENEAEERLSKCYTCPRCSGPMMENSSENLVEPETEESFDIETPYAGEEPSASEEEGSAFESEAEENQRPQLEEDESQPSWEMVEEGLASYDQFEVEGEERYAEGFFEGLESQEQIRWVQNALNQAMGLNLSVDGIVGSKTINAIRNFQQKLGLKVDGIVGPETEAALKAAVSSVSTNLPPAVQGKLVNADTIRVVQMALNALYGLRLAVDGILGDYTKSALEKFKLQENLQSYDQLDNTVLKSLISKVASASGINSQICPNEEVIDRFKKGKDIPQDDKAGTAHFLTIIKIALCVSESQKTSSPIRFIGIIGHASKEGDYNFNMELGRLRARKVASYLKAAIEIIGRVNVEIDPATPQKVS